MAFGPTGDTSFSLLRSRIGDGTDVQIFTNSGEGTIAGYIRTRGESFGNKVHQFNIGNSDPLASAFINDDLFVAREETGQSFRIDIEGTTASAASTVALASSAMVPLDASQIPAGVTLCTCSFMRWGHWMADMTLADGDVVRAHLAHWVAGELASTVDITSLTGTATFNGHAIGTINDSGVRQFVADMSATYNFGTMSGTLSINNIEGQNFQFAMTPSDTQEHRFHGAMTVGPGAYTGDTRGAFYNNGANKGHGIAGDFYLRDSGTLASMTGVYVGER